MITDVTAAIDAVPITHTNAAISANNFKNISRERIYEVAKIVGLENRIKDKVSTYSLGMKQRLSIAEALINSPKLLILDEPTNGLDIEGTIEMRELIKRLSSQGIAILISTHNLTEIDNVCNRIITIQNGKMLSDEYIEEFKGNMSSEQAFIKKVGGNKID